ncbi:MAG TPA: ABC transporter ATP-binding protein [Armatimonadota bacterium]|nr:ABC transporter ATP-binding protein [Armatimonadota bacterium]
MADTIPVIITKDLKKTYCNGPVETPVLKGINMQVDAGEFLSIVGPSGSGKTTLLNIIGALDRPTSGLVLVNGQDISSLDDSELAVLRGETIGFIFQSHYLLEEFNVLENVLMPITIRRGAATKAEEEWVKYILNRVGMSERLTYKPNQLSGGQAQRVAIVRALANKPKLILADEPTGNLDTKTGQAVFQVMLDLNAEVGTAFVLVTHDERLAQQAECTLHLVDGQVVDDTCKGERKPVRVQMIS